MKYESFLIAKDLAKYCNENNITKDKIAGIVFNDRTEEYVLFYF